MASSNYKVIFLGDAGVGKTSIISRRVQGTFDFKMVPTVGAGSEVTEVEIPDGIVELRCWDTAGQEQFSQLVPLYLRGAQVAVLVASLVDHISISHLEKWRTAVEEKGTGTKIIVCVNKTDLQSGPTIIDEMRARLLEDFPGPVLFVSARSGEGIDELFFSIATTAAAQEPASAKVDKGVDLAQEHQGEEQKHCC